MVVCKGLDKGYKRDTPGWASGRVDEQKIQWQLFLVRFSYVELGLGRSSSALFLPVFASVFPGANAVAARAEQLRAALTAPAALAALTRKTGNGVPRPILLSASVALSLLCAFSSLLEHASFSSFFHAEAGAGARA
jgi:hypothetical protein